MGPGWVKRGIGIFRQVCSWKRARFGARGQTRMKNDPRCARASSRPLALSAVPGGATLGDAFTRRASAAEEDLDEDADDVAGDEDRAHVPASRGSAPALRAKKNAASRCAARRKLSTCPFTDMSPGAHSNFERNRGRFRIAIAFDSSSLRRAMEMTGRVVFFRRTPGAHDLEHLPQRQHGDDGARGGGARRAARKRCDALPTLLRRGRRSRAPAVAAATTLCAMRARDGGGATAQGDVEEVCCSSCPELKTVGCVVALVQR